MSFNREIPMIGFHTRIGTHDGANAIIRLIEEGFAPMGINTLILEFNPGYHYECFPEYSNGEFDKADALRVKEACKKHGIRPVPLFQCLSHQSNFGGKPWPLYKAHPEFMETPQIPEDATWPDIYCQHWCASNDDIYDYVFPMIDELIDVFEAEAVHIGLDEVFDIGEECCPRCRGKDKAQLYARTVKILHDHLTEKGVDTMIWGDRLLDCKKLGYQMWEADRFGIHRAYDLPEITRDLIICDWHYDMHSHGYPSIEQFMKGGFFTVPSLGASLDQCKHFWGFCLEDLYMGRKEHWAGKLGGVLFTHWSAMNSENADEMLRAIRGEEIISKDAWGSAAVGKVIHDMCPNAKNFKKVY